MKRVALITAFNKGKLLLGKRKDHGTWTVPGGSFEEGESPEEAAKRELYEEAGLKPYSLSFIKEQQINDNLKLYLFSAYISGDPVPHSNNDPDDEVGKWDWVEIENGLDSKYYNNLHGPDDIDRNLLKQLFKEKNDLNKSEDEVSRLLNHGNINERLIGLKLATVTPEHLEQAALDPNPDIYRTAIDHKLFGEDQIYKLLAAKQRVDGQHPLEQQLYLLSKPDRIKSHHLDALWRGVEELPYDVRAKAIDIILTHPLAESSLIRNLYLLPDLNKDQRLLAIRHQNCPEDTLDHAVQLAQMVPSEDSIELAKEAIKHSSINKSNLIKIIKMAVEQPQNSSLQQLAEHSLQSCQLDDDVLNYLLLQHKLRPGVGKLLACALNGPMGNEFNINRANKEAGPQIWNDNQLPDSMNEEHLNHLVQYAAKTNNKPLLNRVLDHKNINSSHLSILLNSIQGQP